MGRKFLERKAFAVMAIPAAGVLIKSTAPACVFFAEQSEDEEVTSFQEEDYL